MPTTLLPGSEFQINVNSGGNNGISGAQDLADIALLPDGRFVVAYQSDYFGSATDTDPIFAIFSDVGSTRWPIATPSMPAAIRRCRRSRNA